MAKGLRSLDVTQKQSLTAISVIFIPTAGSRDGVEFYQCHIINSLWGEKWNWKEMPRISALGRVCISGITYSSEARILEFS